MCSNCGHVHQELELKDREWLCSACSTYHLRDENASKNIRSEGIRIIRTRDLRKPQVREMSPGVGSTPHGDDVRLGACPKLLSVK
jgi:putative transposase